MSKHELSYARPEHQVTLALRAQQFTLGLLVAVGWMAVAGGLVGGLGYLAWGMAGMIEERTAFWWRPTTTFTQQLIVGQNAAFIGVLAALLLLVIWGRWRKTARRRQAMLLLSHVRLAASLNLPLPKLLASGGAGEPKRVRDQLKTLRETLEAGTTIAAALQNAAPELPSRVIETVAVAEQNGTLEASIDRLMAAQGLDAGRDVASFAVHRAYVLLTLSMLLGMCSTIMIFVVPKFEQILRDFDLPPPAALTQATGFLRGIWPLPLVLLIWVLLLLIAGGAARAIFVHRDRADLFRGPADHVKWMLPVTHAFARDRGLADTCELLADGLAARRPAPAALGLAILPTTNRVLAERLETWQRELAQGRRLHEGAALAGLPQLVVAMLAPVQRPDAAAEALRFLSTYYRNRYLRLRTVLQAAVAPTATLILAGMVFLVAATLFATLLTIVQGVA